MKKIGVISELTLSNVNYGNRLQAFALNNYLNEVFKNYLTYSIILDSKQKYKITEISPLHNIAFITRGIWAKNKKKSLNSLFIDRMNLCNNFTQKNIKFLDYNVKWKDFYKLDYDVFIVGSDVVWTQSKHVINRIKFLDFKTKKQILKFSYAASFGKDYIPENNKKYIIKYLSSFSGISVREKSSVKMLSDIGVKNVKHICDPTLLLSKKQWNDIALNPNLTTKKFIFVYLLGKSEIQRNYITNFAKDNNLLVINIPHANGKTDSIDDNFGDIRFNKCSPENWIWLINHAEYVFTDSFHGIVFSTIFEKKFIALKRDTKNDKNNRIIDYLKTINQSDKFISITDCNIFSLNWDYDIINSNLEVFIKDSKKYLNELLK